jgi:hypothetical protein
MTPASMARFLKALYREGGIVLLRYKFAGRCDRRLVPQQGHHGRRFASALIKHARTAAIESGTWRSGRNGGPSDSVGIAVASSHSGRRTLITRLAPSSKSKPTRADIGLTGKKDGRYGRA